MAIIVNNKYKAFTSIEQSRKLAEFLPLESSDMYYQYVLPKSDKVKHNPEIGNPINALEWYNKGYTLGGKESIKLDEYCVPCWSLSALLSVLPQSVRLVGTPKDSYWYCECVDSNNQWYAGFESADNPVDACYEMILKLNELNLL